MISKTLVENTHGHGAIKPSVFSHLHRKIRIPKVGRASVPFDWSKGFDLEDTISLQRKDQDGSFSCGGQAGSSFLEASRKLEGKGEVISAKSVYAPIHAPGGGVGIDSLETQISVKGGNQEGTVPSYMNGLPPSESWMETTIWQTQSLIEDAQSRAGFTPNRVPIDIDSIAEAVRDLNGVIIMIAGQNNGTWDSAFPLPPSKSNPNELWYHYLFVKGAKMLDGKKYLSALNSWGLNVGLNGIQYFGEDYITPKFVITASSFIKDSILQPIPSNTSIWAKLVTWFNSLATQPA